MAPEILVWNGERAQVGRWRELDGVGVIAPVQGAMPPTVAFVAHCCSHLATQGFQRVVTPAIGPVETFTYAKAQFTTREQLHVLVHRLDNIPDAKPDRSVLFRRARQSDVPEVLQLDAEAFDEFWRFDRGALVEAVTATPQSRFRVAVAGIGFPGAAPGTIVGYGISGRNRSQGFLQRLAVTPGYQGMGIGTALIEDCLAWLTRRKSRTCIVNTQESNARALRLYKSCGFEQASSGLYVMERQLMVDR